jgi:hypothetical protein
VGVCVGCVWVWGCVWDVGWCVCVKQNLITRSSYCYFVLKISIMKYYEAYRSFAQLCHNSKLVVFQERRLKFLKCYTFLWVQRRHNCSPAASFTHYVVTLYSLKVRLQTFLSIPVTQKCQILSCDALVANERNVLRRWVEVSGNHTVNTSCLHAR